MFRKFKHSKHTVFNNSNETNMYRCKRCGAICDKTKTRIADARKDTNVFLHGTEYELVETNVYGIKSLAGTGCWNCGTLYSR